MNNRDISFSNHINNSSNQEVAMNVIEEIKEVKSPVGIKDEAIYNRGGTAMGVPKKSLQQSGSPAQNNQLNLSSMALPVSAPTKKSKAAKKKVQDQTLNQGQMVLQDKYKDISGVTEWFQAKKLELEAQGGATGASNQASSGQSQSQAKKTAVLLGLPLSSHIWRPPRIESDRFQAD